MTRQGNAYIELTIPGAPHETIALLCRAVLYMLSLRGDIVVHDIAVDVNSISASYGPMWAATSDIELMRQIAVFVKEEE